MKDHQRWRLENKMEEVIARTAIFDEDTVKKIALKELIKEQADKLRFGGEEPDDVVLGLQLELTLYIAALVTMP